MHLLIFAIIVLVLHFLSRIAQHKLFADSPEREEAFRRLYYKWSWRAVWASIIFGMVFYILLKTFSRN